MDSAAREAINTKLRNQFMNTMREVVGIVQNISSRGEGLRSLAVQIELPDVSPPKVFTSSTPKLVQKNITVLIDGETQIEGSSDFNTGDTVHILLNKSAYSGSEFNALKISIRDRVKEIMKQVTNANLIHGKIRKKGSTTIVLSTRVPDSAKLSTLDVSGSFVVPYVEKEYVIIINANTKFPGVSFATLKVGDQVSAWGEGELFKKDSFIATKIIKEQ